MLAAAVLYMSMDVLYYLIIDPCACRILTLSPLWPAGVVIHVCSRHAHQDNRSIQLLLQDGYPQLPNHTKRKVCVCFTLVTLVLHLQQYMFTAHHTVVCTALKNCAFGLLRISRDPLSTREEETTQTSNGES